MNAQALIQAERESALFHLYGALLGLCHEIAGFYRLPQAASRAELLLNDEVLEALPFLSWPRCWSWPATRNLAGETAALMPICSTAGREEKRENRCDPAIDSGG
jgi:hypothetical protein